MFLIQFLCEAVGLLVCPTAGFKAPSRMVRKTQDACVAHLGAFDTWA